MYGWIWRHLPFGRWGKLAGSLLLTGVAVATLWYVVFPWAEPLLPFDDVQVTQDGGTPGDEFTVPYDTASPDVVAPTGDEHDIPYATVEPTPGS